MASLKEDLAADGGMDENWDQYGSGSGSTDAYRNASATNYSYGSKSADSQKPLTSSYASASDAANRVALVDEEVGGDLDDMGKPKKKVEMHVVVDGQAVTVHLDSGEKRLADLGYTQDLKRVLGLSSLIAIGINAASIFVGPYYAYALLSGGPSGVVWYWWITVFFTHMLFASLAEIASSFPTAGSLYFWSAALAPPSIRPLAAWVTGWFEFAGIAIGAGGIALSGTWLLQSLVLIWTGGANGDGYVMTQNMVFGLSCAMVAVSALVSLLPVRLIGQFFIFSTLVQVAGGIALLIALPIAAPTTQSAWWVFVNHDIDLEEAGVPDQAYAFIMALLMSQYFLYGFDLPAHFAEEAKRADVNVPISMVASTSIVSILGWALLVVLTFCIQNFDNLFDSDTVTGGDQPVFQILWDCFYTRYGTPVPVYVFGLVIYFAFFSICIAMVNGSARVAYALARDGGLPLSKIWERVNSQKVPVNALVLTCFVSIVSLLPLLAGNVAWSGVSGAATVGWFCSYIITIFFRLVQRDGDFVPGPFFLANHVGHLGRKVMNVLALLYSAYTIIVFCLPSSFPVTASNFNYTVVCLGIVLLIIIPWWILDAHRWFKGPRLPNEGKE